MVVKARGRLAEIKIARNDIAGFPKTWSRLLENVTRKEMLRDVGKQVAVVAKIAA